MGLSISHNAFSSSYGGFSEWRRQVCKIGGFTYREENRHGYISHVPEVDWDALPVDEGLQGHWTQEPSDPLLYLIAHSDADGELSPYRCARLSDRLAGLLPAIRASVDPTDWWGQRIPDMTVQFIAGLRDAASKGEKIEFY